MEDLKRAYARVMLDTTKEAAARLMAADLRARRLEAQLDSTKDEATRMLLRLKRMMDEEVEKAKASSSKLQQKVDELECQLNEAEGIVIDLRAELYQAQKQSKEKNEKQLPIGRNEYEELHDLETNGNNTNRGLFTPSLDALPESVIGNDKTWRPNVPGERSSTLQEGEEEEEEEEDDKVSVIHKSQRKRKLKVWDDVVATLGLRHKKPRHTLPSLSNCTASMLKQCLGADNQSQVEEEEVEIEENVGNLQENNELNDKDEEDAELEAGYGTEGGCGETKTSSKFNHARRKLFQYAIGRKWRSLSTIYPDNGSLKKES